MDFGGTADRKIYQLKVNLKVDRFFLKLTQKLDPEPQTQFYHNR